MALAYMEEPRYINYFWTNYMKKIVSNSSPDDISWHIGWESLIYISNLLIFCTLIYLNMHDLYIFFVTGSHFLIRKYKITAPNLAFLLLLILMARELTSLTETSLIILITSLPKVNNNNLAGIKLVDLKCKFTLRVPNSLEVIQMGIIFFVFWLM